MQRPPGVQNPGGLVLSDLKEKIKTPLQDSRPVQSEESAARWTGHLHSGHADERGTGRSDDAGTVTTSDSSYLTPRGSTR